MTTAPRGTLILDESIWLVTWMDDFWILFGIRIVLRFYAISYAAYIYIYDIISHLHTEINREYKDVSRVWILIPMFQDYIIVSYGPFSARKSTLSHARTSAGRQEGPSTGAQICTDGFSKRERASERERERCTLSLYNLIYPYILMYIHMHRCISESQPAVSCRTSTYSTWRIISLRKWLIICCWKAWFRCPRTRIIQFTAGFKHRCVCKWCVPGSKWQFNGEQYFINTRWPFFIFFPH